MTAKRSTHSTKGMTSSKRINAKRTPRKPVKEKLKFEVKNYETTAREYKDALWEFMNRPGVKYFAGGLATAVLARLASGISERYPEISKFLKENIQDMETKLSELKKEDRGEPLHH